MAKEKPRVVALVPMRHRSERVPGKNYRQFAGRPLYHYILDSLSRCPLVAEVVVDTDSPTIRDGIAAAHSSVQLIERPEHLQGGMVAMNDVLLHDVSRVEADYYLQTHCTNPLLRANTIEDAIRTFLENTPGYDSLFSVTSVQTRLWDRLTRPINHNPAILMRTQDLPPIYEENSCLYIFTRETLNSSRSRIGQRPFMYEIDRSEAWDIDEELDFKIAEFLFETRRRQTS